MQIDRSKPLLADRDITEAVVKVLDAKFKGREDDTTVPMANILLPVVAALGENAAKIIGGLTTDKKELENLLNWFSEQVRAIALITFHDAGHPRFSRTLQ